METTGKVKKVDIEVSGENANGVWVRRGVVVQPVNSEKCLYFEYNGQDWSDRLGELEEGQMVTVRWDAESREYEDKWYTKLHGYGLQVYQKQPQA